jgi:hypothetical protein
VKKSNREPGSVGQQAARFTRLDPNQSQILMNITIASPCQLVRISIHAIQAITETHKEKCDTDF